MNTIQKRELVLGGIIPTSMEGERPFGPRFTTTTDFDNTSDPRSRGDFAVPTLFNGNFDVSFSGNSESVTNNGVRNFWQAAIPGWSYHNGRPDQFDREGTSVKYGIDIENLVDWKKISTLSEDYRQQVGYSETQPNYALKMDGGDSIVHNRFVVPDWGSLRFDLHTGDIPKTSTNNLRVTLEATDGSGISTQIELQEAGGTAGQYLNDTRRIGYGETGFETFTFDVPDNLRGKIATLRFELAGGQEIYLDNIFFKSQHLLFGNPSEARKPDIAIVILMRYGNSSE